MKQELRDILARHLLLYPSMEVEDCLKLLYQNEMGGGHLIQDSQAFAAYLREEFCTPGLFERMNPQTEAIGTDVFRLHLSSLGGGPDVETLTRLCALAAEEKAKTGSLATLKENCLGLMQMIGRGELTYGPKGQETVRLYIENGCPQLHHSERFRKNYQPHYRLIDRQTAFFLPVLIAVDKARKQNSHILVGIDGMSSAGKSSLSGLLQKVYHCGVLHADDFFLQPHQRTESRLAEPGGNIDYERLAPVAKKAQDDRGFSYQAYNCMLGKLDQWKHVKAGPVHVLEGSYSLHPQVDASCDVRVFLSVDAKEQERRILHRNGPEMLDRFMTQWVPMENRYFSQCNIRESCDVVIDTTELSQA